MVYRKTAGTIAFDTILVIVCVLIGLITLYPMWYVICCSISEPREVLKGAVTIWPRGFSLSNYRTVLFNTDFWNAAKMSVFYTTVCTVGMLVACMLMAYPLTRPNLFFRKFVVIFLVVPMYFGGGMAATFIIYTKVLGLYNTIWAVILPGFVSIFNIILCRTYVAGLPHDLSEAAFIDGAGNFQVLLRIVVPLSKPVLAVIAIYTIVGIWNSWWNSMLYQTKTYLHPLQMYMQRLLIQQSINIMDLAESGADAEEIMEASRKAMSARTLKFTFITVATLPILLTYPMFQKHFVKGVMLGSLKG